MAKRKKDWLKCSLVASRTRDGWRILPRFPINDVSQLALDRLGVSGHYLANHVFMSEGDIDTAFGTILSFNASSDDVCIKLRRKWGYIELNVWVKPVPPPPLELQVDLKWSAWSRTVSDWTEAGLADTLVAVESALIGVSDRPVKITSCPRRASRQAVVVVRKHQAHVDMWDFWDEASSLAQILGVQDDEGFRSALPWVDGDAPGVSLVSSIRVRSLTGLLRRVDDMEKDLIHQSETAWADLKASYGSDTISDPSRQN